MSASSNCSDCGAEVFSPFIWWCVETCISLDISCMFAYCSSVFHLTVSCLVPYFFINFTYFYIRHICKLSLFVCYSFLVCNNLIALYICQHSHCIFFLINIVESVHPTQPKNIFADHICKLFHVVSLTHMGAPCFILCKEE
jgi:hypothetical protein